MEKLRIFLAEDHKVVREGLKLLIDGQPDMEIVGEADDGREAVEKALALHPDVVVMDISMPELSGAKAAQLLIQKRPGLRVLALSVHEEKGYLRELLAAGVAGYVLKRSAADELISAIRVVANQGVYLDPSLAGKVVKGFIEKPSVGEDPSSSALSLREREVLGLIAQGYSGKEIASQLHLSPKTIETYKARGMAKARLYSRADIVRFAVQHGWMEDDQA
jgi:DNA-binding NarL/FixJ family response regulator